MKTAVIWFLSLVLLVLASGFFASSCGASAEDIRLLSTQQEKSGEQISRALAKLGDGLITPQDAKLVVDDAVKESNAATAVVINEMQNKILSWWQVAATAIAIALPVVGAGMKLVVTARDKTRPLEIAREFDRLLVARGLAPKTPPLAEDGGG